MSRQSSDVSAGQKFVTSVGRCARCGEDHRAVLFEPFTKPPGEDTHFGFCPRTGEPILLQRLDGEGREMTTDPKEMGCPIHFHALPGLGPLCGREWTDAEGQHACSRDPEHDGRCICNACEVGVRH